MEVSLHGFADFCIICPLVEAEVTLWKSIRPVYSSSPTIKQSVIIQRTENANFSLH